jgi:hypothetical protein
MSTRKYFVILIAFVLLISNVNSVSSQTYLPGVSPGEWFKYEFTGSIDNASGNITSREFEIFAEAEYIQLLITSVEGIEIGYKMSAYFENGTILDWLQLQCDLSGELSSTPLTTMYQSPVIHPDFVAANLNPEDTMVPEGEDSFTGSYNMTFSGIEQQVNYYLLNITNEDRNYIWEAHYEKVTGVPIYIHEKRHNFLDNYFFREYSLTLIDSNTSIIPEVPTWLILPLFLIITLSGVAFRKKIRMQ